jgi:hypothetical protein
MLGPVVEGKDGPALPNGRRRGSVGGSTVKQVCDKKFDEVAESIFQFDRRELWDESFATNTSGGVKNEARIALHGARILDKACGTTGTKTFYAAPVANPEIPCAFRLPDVVYVQDLTTAPGYKAGQPTVAYWYGQVKCRTSKMGDREWTDHDKERCIKAGTAQTLRCRCKAPFYRFDQLFWEMMGECSANLLITGNDIKTELLWVWWSDHPLWWRENRPTFIEFYDRYLKWYWELDRSEQATREIRRLVAKFNEETLEAARLALQTRESKWFNKSRRGWIDIDVLLTEWRPQRDEDIETSRRWSAMRKRVAHRARRLSPAIRRIALMAGLKKGTEQMYIIVARLIGRNLSAQSVAGPAVGGKRKTPPPGGERESAVKRTA